jgi:hypothetical protein
VSFWKQRKKAKIRDIINVFPVVDSTEGRGIRTPSGTLNSSLHSTNKSHTKQAQKLAKTNTYKNPKNANLNKTSTSPKQDNNTSLHKKCAICVHQNFPANSNLLSEVIELIRLWPKLSKRVKKSIKVLMKTVKS